MRNTVRVIAILALAILAPLALLAQTPAPAGVKMMGAVRSLSGNSMTLTTDQGSAVNVQIPESARILSMAPGQTDLKTATVLQVSDLKVGDRVLVRGKLAEDGSTVQASAVIAIRQQALAQWRQQQLLDWQRRGVGGVVKQVDTSTGSITLTMGSHVIEVSTTPKTVCKRYAPDSVKWEDVKDSSLSEIHPGDQLRARGDKNADGTQVTAEEIVSGSFRNISGLITSVDAAASTLTVQDLATKKSVTVQITADSQMKKLSAQMAQGLAMRLKGGASAAAPAAGAAPDASKRGDLNQLLGRLPAATLAELQKGEAVMIVSTQGSATKAPVAITLLGGVEALLTSTENQSLLTPWSLAGSPSGDQ